MDEEGARRSMILEVLFAGTYLVMAVIYVFSVRQLRGFLAETRTIADTTSLERYKELVRGQMHLALVTIAVLLTGLGLGIALIRRHGLWGLTVVLLVNAAVLGTGLYHKRLETRIRSLPTASSELDQAYQRISATWLKKALPDF